MGYELFTDRARKVMQLANQEAQRFNHEYIGTEHVLLGLILTAQKEGGAAKLLRTVDLRIIRLEVEKLIKPVPDMVTMGKLPQTPMTKNVIECAMEEARNLNHNYVGTEHILLGLLSVQAGVAAQVLNNLGFKLDDVRREIFQICEPTLDLVQTWRGIAAAHREEARLIRGTIKAATDAEERCNVRAEILDRCANELEKKCGDGK